MSGIGIAYGMIGTATIAACVYMFEHGYESWQVLLVILLGVLFTPSYRQRGTNDAD